MIDFTQHCLAFLCPNSMTWSPQVKRHRRMSRKAVISGVIETCSCFFAFAGYSLASGTQTWFWCSPSSTSLSPVDLRRSSRARVSPLPSAVPISSPPPRRPPSPPSTSPGDFCRISWLKRPVFWQGASPGSSSQTLSPRPQLSSVARWIWIHLSMTTLDLLLGWLRAQLPLLGVLRRLASRSSLPWNCCHGLLCFHNVCLRFILQPSSFRLQSNCFAQVTLG